MPSDAPDAPVDNLLLRAPKYNAFAAFFKALAVVAPDLLRHDTPAAVQFPHSFQPDPDPNDKILTFPCVHKHKHKHSPPVGS